MSGAYKVSQREIAQIDYLSPSSCAVVAFCILRDIFTSETGITPRMTGSLERPSKVVAVMSVRPLLASAVANRREERS